MSNEEKFPLKIEDDEVILRAAFRPFNIRKNGKIKPNIFVPPKNLDELSCMRSSIMNISECLDKAKEIAGGNKEFHGFALITNFCANNSSPPSEYGSVYIQDSRSYYLGHADLIIGIKTPINDEPLSAIDKEKFDFIKDNLYKHSVFVIPNSTNGPEISSCDKSQLLTNFANEVLDTILKA